MAQLNYTRLMTPRSHARAGLSGTHICIPACPSREAEGRDRTISRKRQHSESLVYAVARGLCLEQGRARAST